MKRQSQSAVIGDLFAQEESALPATSTALLSSHQDAPAPLLKTSLHGATTMPCSREDLIHRSMWGEHVLAVAFCGQLPEGEPPYGETSEYEWVVEEIQPLEGDPYRRISCYRIINPAPDIWMAAWKGCEHMGIKAPPSCPHEFFKMAPVQDEKWRAWVKDFPPCVPNFIKIMAQ